MDYPFTRLKPEYSSLLNAMTVRPECRDLVNHVAVRLISFKNRYAPVTAAIGVPAVFIGPSFEREASSDFNKNPAQGWPLTSRSRDIPHNGPFRTWLAAALAAYHLNGLDKVGAGNWTWEHVCFYGEMFNGFGYRDFHHMHSPYLWGGTNIQTVGKYTEDGKFVPNDMDPQLGIIPVGRRMVEIDPTLALPTIIPPPMSSGISVTTTDAAIDTKWVQQALNDIGWYPALDVDGSYGNETKTAIENFQRNYGLSVDGLAGPETIDALKIAVAAAKGATT